MVARSRCQGLYERFVYLFEVRVVDKREKCFDSTGNHNFTYMQKRMKEKHLPLFIFDVVSI